MRVHLRDGGDPVALDPPATVLDVADSIHHELADALHRRARSGARRRGSRASGSGPEHELADGDTVEVLSR